MSQRKKNDLREEVLPVTNLAIRRQNYILPEHV